MATGQLTGIIRNLRRATLLPEGARMTDGQLLRDYLRRRDEAALATLVERHAPMVWGVCCRVLADYHDAEDAFQATFLVLVRRASSIASPELLANWLYGVVHQTATKARAMAARRRTRERQVTDMPEPAAAEQGLWNDLRPLLDEELSRLPETHRTVLVLCDLEGKTRAEAARSLCLPEGTVGSRLARARAMLAKRLARRGVVLSGGALAAVLSQNVASAGAPVAVVSNTICAASAVAAGQAAAGPVSVEAAALADGVLKAMMLTKLKVVVAVALVLGLLAAGATVLSVRSAWARGNQPPAAEASVPAPQKPDQQKEVFTAWGKEINGLQAGVGFPAGQNRAYRHGETVTLVVRIRNVGKEEVKFQYVPAFFKENLPTVIDAAGQPVPLQAFLGTEILHPSADVTLAPGKEVELYEWRAALRPASETKNPNFEIIYGTGKFSIQYERVLGNTTVSAIKIDAALSKLATGKLELEVKEPEKQPQKKEEKESFTAWGKEIKGLQSGLGFRAGEKRAYHFGEKVQIVARIRNLTKEVIEFEHIWAFFVENAPKILDPSGKVVQLPRYAAEGRQMPRITKVPPGGEVALYEWEFDLDAGWKANHGAGTFTLQCERFVGPTLGNRVHPNPALEKLATGKLELEVTSEPPEKRDAKPDAPRELTVGGTVVDEDGKPVDGAVVTIQRSTDAEGAGKPRVEEYGKTKTDAKGRFEIKSLTAVWETEPRSGFDFTFAAPGMAPGALGVGKGFDSKKEIIIVLKRQKEPVTAWGKEINGLQAGLSVGEPLSPKQGNAVTLIVRVRNVGKEAVRYQYDWGFFVENQPTVTDGAGKQSLGKSNCVGGVKNVRVTLKLAPGQETELYSSVLELTPGKYQIEFKRVFGDNSQAGGENVPLDPTLSKLATGKLELDIHAKKQ
jgi:RNA polymerase sigma factor (sigma-70 family)